MSYVAARELSLASFWKRNLDIPYSSVQNTSYIVDVPALDLMEPRGPGVRQDASPSFSRWLCSSLWCRRRSPSRWLHPCVRLSARRRPNELGHADRAHSDGQVLCLGSILIAGPQWMMVGEGSKIVLPCLHLFTGPVTGKCSDRPNLCRPNTIHRRSQPLRSDSLTPALRFSTKGEDRVRRIKETKGPTKNNSDEHIPI